MWLAAAFAGGLAISYFAWRPALVGGMLAGVVGVCFYFIWQGIAGGTHRWLDAPLIVYSGPALLLGWAAGLLIRRTLAERAAR